MPIAVRSITPMAWVIRSSRACRAAVDKYDDELSSAAAVATRPGAEGVVGTPR